MAGMKVTAYRVVPLDKKKAARVERLLEKVAALSIENRIRIVGMTEVRLEELQTIDGLYLMDFTRLRFDHGPGLADRTKPIKGFTFAEGQGFGEETGALYDPTTRHMIVQYNHFGVRAGRIGEYLSQIDDVADNLYELEPRYDEEVEQALQRKSIIRRLRFRVAAHEISKADRSSGVSLGAAVRAGHDAGAETVEVSIAASRSKRTSGLDMSSVKRHLKWLTRRLGADEHSVELIKVTGKDDPDTRAETLDLLGQRLAATFSDVTVGPDLRYPKDERWNALLRARKGWAKALSKKP